MAAAKPAWICPTCCFVTGLPPAICPLCGDQMMEVSDEDPAAEDLVNLPLIESWLTSGEAASTS